VIPRRDAGPTILTAVDAEGEPTPTLTPARRGNRGWWIALAAALAAFLAVAVGLSMSAAGPGPGLAASAPPLTPAGPSAQHGIAPQSIPPCATGTACVEIAIIAPSLSATQYAAVKPRSDEILRVVSTIDWCASRPCSGGARPLVESDVAVLRAALARAGYPDAEVGLVDHTSMIRYVVPVPPACVTGFLASVQGPPIGHTAYRARSDGRCDLP